MRSMALVKQAKSPKKSRITLPIMVASLLLVPVFGGSAIAQDAEDSNSEGQEIVGTVEVESMEPGSFACDNNPNPICENPAREITSESWSCSNNPGPDCAEPPRVGAALEPGSWACVNNHNVASCENPIRYTVDDPDGWPDRFPRVENPDS